MAVSINMDRIKCCFIGAGYKNISYKFNEENSNSYRAKEVLKEAIKRLIEEEGATHFISSMALGVNQLAAEAVLELRKSYPKIILECVLPFENQAVKWTEEQREYYFSILKGCDKETLFQNKFSRGYMQKCNKYLVEQSDLIMVAWNGKSNHNKNTIYYAKQLGKKMIMINLETMEL